MCLARIAQITPSPPIIYRWEDAHEIKIIGKVVICVLNMGRNHFI